MFQQRHGCSTGAPPAFAGQRLGRVCLGAAALAIQNNMGSKHHAALQPKQSQHALFGDQPFGVRCLVIGEHNIGVGQIAVVVFAIKIEMRQNIADDIQARL